MPLRDRLIAAGVVLALLAVLGTAAAWRVLDDDTSPTESATAPAPAPEATGPSSTADPEEWPIELEPLVEFVERERGGPFTNPVRVEYLEEDEYRDAVVGETTDTTPEDAADLEIWEGQLRALGLVDPGVDLQDALDQLYGEGTLAYYDDEEDVVRVLGTRLDIAHQVTLVHELVHAWQDQHGFLDDYRELDDTPAYVLQTLAEGDASRIETAFVDTLSSGELEDYYDQSADQARGIDLDGVPEALLASFAGPYLLGEQFVSVLDHIGGNDEVDTAFEQLPASEADLMDPTRYLDGILPVEVAEPAVPAGAELLDAGPFGATSWLITLAERIDPRDALDLVDRWAGDSAVIYRVDGRTCTAVAYQGQAPTDLDLAMARIGEWADASAGLAATAERVGDTAVLRSCEPTDGGAEVAGRSQTSVQYPATRLEAAVQALDEGASLEEALCFGDALVDQVTYQQMDDGVLYLPGQSRDLVDRAAEACLN